MEDLALTVTDLEEQVKVLRGYILLWFMYGVFVSGYAFLLKIDTLALNKSLQSVLHSENHIKAKYNMLLNDFIKLRKQKTEVATKNMDNDTIKKLIRLCHPDKHNNSKVSTEMTQLLNALKNDM